MAFGLIMPNHAGGSDSAWLAALGIVVAAAWYIVIRLHVDPHIPVLWRPLLMLLGVGCAVLTSLAAVGGIDRHVDAWRAYGDTPALPAAAAACAVAYAIVRIGAWVDHRRVGRSRTSETS